MKKIPQWKEKKDKSKPYTCIQMNAFEVRKY
jgi:hypothetical protein